MSFIENGVIRLGIDLNLGGAITWLSRSGGENIVNSWDLGRQIQMSHYSGPVPFSVGENRPEKHWAHLGWNPIQAGDDYGHGSRTVEHQNDSRSLHTVCAPMQWPLDDVPAECVFETWLELDGPVVQMRCRMRNDRSDAKQYLARGQEMPAVYLNAPFHKVLSYTGARPFTNDAVSEIPRQASNPNAWSNWLATERWSALVNDEGWGLGLWNPSCIQFGGGFAGKAGPNNPRSSGTGYITAQSVEILDHNIEFEYHCELILGTVAEIRSRVLGHGRAPPPAWHFDHDRQGWHYVNATDEGWPIKDMLRVRLEENDPQVVGPAICINAGDFSKVMIDAAFITRHQTAEFFWFRHDGTFASLRFPITGDGQMRRHEIRLADSPDWRGVVVRLRFDPVPDGALGEQVEVKSIALER
ncbi:MAG TPA: hypothetical protein VGH65_05320 [Verrucomicrobiaceae bacterium]